MSELVFLFDVTSLESLLSLSSSLETVHIQNMLSCFREATHRKWEEKVYFFLSLTEEITTNELIAL